MYIQIFDKRKRGAYKISGNGNAESCYAMLPTAIKGWNQVAKCIISIMVELLWEQKGYTLAFLR